LTQPPSIDRFLEGVPAGDGLGVASLVRSYLDEGRAFLETLHRSSESGRKVNEANSDLIDRLVRRLFGLAEDQLLEEGIELEQGLCVVAVGGYARREMSIHSDVDLLVVYRGEVTPYVSQIAERLQYWMWDAGLKLGCATRTIRETLNLGRQDETVRTAILTARFLCGDGEFFHEFSDQIQRRFLKDVPAFVQAQADGLRERHEQFGGSLFLLQPNIKEGAGGLRDYHTAYWAVRGSQPAARVVDDFLHFGLLTESEMSEYLAALEFLWRVRNDLHLQTKRENDQMSFELQEIVAEHLGYGRVEDTPSDAELPVESFMRDYYRHARAIENYSELVIDQCAARVSRTRKRRPKEVEDGFRISNGHLEIPHAGHLRENPARVLGAFAVAQSHDVTLSRMAKRLLRGSLSLLGDDQRRDPALVEIFLRILDSEKRVFRTLMAMNEVGVLAAFLPEWEHIVCRWQHVIYHTYTVDIHSIFLVEELRRLWRGKYDEIAPDLAGLMRQQEDRPVLFLGALLHDIGKGFGGQHSEKGAARAMASVERLGLGEERSARVIFLVRHHLLMSHLAQSRDLSDPDILMDFARVCGDRTNLRNLYLVTFADIRASSRDAWNEWKGGLLRELFERTAEILETGVDDRSKAVELVEARVETRREGARGELEGLGLAPESVQGFFDVMPRRYFVAHTPRQIARHAQVVLRYGPSELMSTGRREMRGGFTEFILCARDVHGLYSKVAGTFTACGLNILGSHVYSSRSGFALEVYRITTPKGGESEREYAWQEFERSLSSVLRGDTDVAELLRRQRHPLGLRRLPSRTPPSVAISNDESEFYTIVDVTTDDRIGLLHDLTQAIARQDLEIYLSKAATVLDQVRDTFYLKDASGDKLQDPERIEALRTALLVEAEADPGEDGD